MTVLRGRNVTTVPGAEQSSSTIAMASAIDPLRAKAAKAFAEYFLSVARTVYPRYGFASMTEAEYGALLTLWLAQLTSRTHRNVAAVALANKLARMAWAVLAKNEPYRPPVLADSAAV